MNYYTTELKVSRDKTYNLSLRLPDFKWDGNAEHNVSIVSPTKYSPDLLDAMSNNPKLKVLV